MRPITYLLSESFRYETTIHADSGPGYASRQGWTIARLPELASASAHGPVIVDNRVTEAETPALTDAIRRLSPSLVYVKIVDPYWECIRYPYYHWLLELVRLPNVCLLGPYQAVGLTSLLVRNVGAHRYLHIPYAYEPELERPLDLDRRKGFLVVSGAAYAEFYPERAALLRALRKHRWSSRDVTVLPHPGYPDVGHVAKHQITGGRFVEFLARHRFMYLEPSRDELEFLKYSECAYAGCVPAGRPPATFDAGLRALFAPVESSRLRDDLKQLRRISSAESLDRVQRYRSALAQERSRDTLNARLLAHWEGETARLRNAR